MMDREFTTLERLIARLMQIGVGVSGAILAAGLVLWFARAGAADAVLRSGVLLLVAVPITRILISFMEALHRRDRLLSWATGMVLLIMFSTILYSLQSSAGN